jgi:hypothetical protein
MSSCNLDERASNCSSDGHKPFNGYPNQQSGPPPEVCREFDVHSSSRRFSS